MNEELVINHQAYPQIMDGLPWREHPASQGSHKLDGLVIDDPALDVVQPIDAPVSSHGDLTFMDFFAFDTVWQRHFLSLFDRIVKIE